MPLLLASLTGPLVTLATNLISSIGLLGVGLLTLTSGVIGLPGTEPTMLFAGFSVFEHHLTLVGIIVAGVVGDVVGATIAYSIGFFGQRELLERQGSKLHVSGAGLDRAHRWFDRYGTGVILVSRLLPLIRAVFPYAAGVARMPYWRFLPLATIGSIIWIGALGVVGQAVGHSWQSWRHHLEYVDYAAVVVLVAAIALFIIRRMRRRPADPHHEAPEPVDVVPE
jgi:membrane protein DedA with SNARE-associated domain